MSQLRTTLVFLFIALCGAAFAQQSKRTTIRTSLPDKTIEAFALEKYSVQPEPGLEYHWWKGQRLQATVGGVAGAVLDGPYTEFTPDGQIITCGEMRKGLRHGEWRTWDADGKLRSITKWRKGYVHTKRLAIGGEGITEMKMKHEARNEKRAAEREGKRAKGNAAGEKPRGVQRVKKGRKAKSQDIDQKGLDKERKKKQVEEQRKKKRSAPSNTDGPTS
ncbi:MAG: hypothetical protein ABI599_15180 [Flavobacteriales bacterium]